MITPRDEIGGEWDDYLASFHRERPGITDAVLSRSVDGGGRDPYDWLTDALPASGIVVDVACGNAPLAGRVAGTWIGLDRSRAELDRVVPGRVVLADVAAVPLRDASADAVVCSMALMLFGSPDAAVVEMVRLLRPGARLVALVPATEPLTIRDRARYVRLLAALRLRRLPFRHHRVLDDRGSGLVRSGLRVEADERRRFAYPLPGRDAARLWLRSLYLPGVDVRRRRAARRVTERWVGSDIGLPLRRVVAIKP